MTRLFVAILIAISTSVFAAEPVLLDTDIGSDIDDALALGLVVASPEIELIGVTTVTRPTEDRAWLACRFLTQTGLPAIPVAFGRAPQAESTLDGQVQYRRHPAAIFNRTIKPIKEPAVELMYQLLKDRPGKITLVCLGPLTNVAQLIQEHPDSKPWIKRVVVMGGAIAIGYNGRPPAVPEWNLKTDVAAAKAVFTSGLPLTVVPLDATATAVLGKKERERLFAARTPLTFQMQNLFELWDKESPVLFDPVAVSAVFVDQFLTYQQMQLEIDDHGMTVRKGGAANAQVAVSIERDKFVDWFVTRIAAHGRSILPNLPHHRGKLIEQDGFPVRVHAWEDYETDIEKRWWMCGKPETKDVIHGSSRSFRAVLTQDFDDRMGDTKTMYRAVIFNPVPGPPMGPRTRLRFRFKLAGADMIRVQLYSLSNGYHRYLSIADLPQNRWTEATVDMTQMRRPDGSGGPLAENERIDDIQFYVDPRADLLIDDIVLYEAAAEGEKRPFPRRILFSGWFDTGKQGQEWPGEFAIVPHDKPRTWKSAKSIIGRDGKPCLRIGLRGKRLLDPTAELFFRYRIVGATHAEIDLTHGTEHQVVQSRTVKLKGGDWHEATVAFAPAAGTTADAIVVRLRAGAEMWLDDLLLYVPGSQ